MKIIRRKNGHINVASTLTSFKVDLDKRVKEEDLIRNDESIKNAVSEVFDTTKGFDISRAFLIESVVRKLAYVEGDSYDSVKKKVTKHIYLNCRASGYLSENGNMSIRAERK